MIWKAAAKITGERRVCVTEKLDIIET